MRSPFSTALQSHYMHCRQFAIIIIRDASCSLSVQDMSFVGPARSAVAPAGEGTQESQIVIIGPFKLRSQLPR